jgi:hypothetical protein
MDFWSVFATSERGRDATVAARHLIQSLTIIDSMAGLANVGA